MAKKKTAGEPPPDRGGSPRATAQTPASAVPLEAFFVACQKSLARAVRNAQQSGKADNEFALGERPVYMIESVDMDVSAGLSMATGERGAGECVLVDLQAPAGVRSQIRFRVQSKPVELLKGAKLELANLDPLGESAPIARLRAWLVDDGGRPVPNYRVDLHFARAGEKKAKASIFAATDSAGRVDFFVEPGSDEVKIVGDRKRRRVFLRGSGRGVNRDEYFVWAVAARQSSWTVVAAPSAPFPPQAVSRDSSGLPDVLISEMHRIRIE